MVIGRRVGHHLGKRHHWRGDPPISRFNHQIHQSHGIVDSIHSPYYLIEYNPRFSIIFKVLNAMNYDNWCTSFYSNGSKCENPFMILINQFWMSLVCIEDWLVGSRTLPHVWISLSQWKRCVSLLKLHTVLTYRLFIRFFTILRELLVLVGSTLLSLIWHWKPTLMWIGVHVLTQGGLHLVYVCFLVLL